MIAGRTNKSCGLPQPHQRQDAEQFIRSIAERYVEPSHEETAQRFGDQIIQIALHGLVPPQPHKNGVRTMEPATTLTGRIPPSKTKGRISAADTAERVGFALQAWGKEKSAAIERVRQIAGVDRKTAASWYRGKSAPRSEHLINLARDIPELKGEVRRLLCMEEELHPDLDRAMSELIRNYQLLKAAQR